MKKLLILSFLAMASTPAFCWTKVIRENRGLFGYRTVSESSAGPNTILLCSNPGWSGCHGSSITTGGGVVGSVIDNAVIQEVNKMVDAIIVNLAYGTGTQGVFNYGTGWYVEYTYDFPTDRIETNIYTTQEAHDLGLL